MARTRGTSRLPLPPSLVLVLDELGFQPFTPPGKVASKSTHTYVLMSRPTFTIQLVASNIPGDTAVTAVMPSMPATRIDVDGLIAVLRAEVRRVLSPSQRANDILDQLGIGVTR